MLLPHIDMQCLLDAEILAFYVLVC